MSIEMLGYEKNASMTDVATFRISEFSNVSRILFSPFRRNNKVFYK